MRLTHALIVAALLAGCASIPVAPARDSTPDMVDGCEFVGTVFAGTMGAFSFTPGLNKRMAHDNLLDKAAKKLGATHVVVTDADSGWSSTASVSGRAYRCEPS